MGLSASIVAGANYVAKKITPQVNASAPPAPPAAIDAAATREAQAAAANRVRSGAAGTGRSGTILTSPLGLLNEPAGARKQLLGA